MKSRLDELDNKIINELVRVNNRLNSRKFALELGVNAATIRRRIQRLFELGYIKTVVVPEPDEVGYGVKVEVGLDVAPRKVSSVVKALAAKTEVKVIFVTAGRFDIIFSGWFTGTEECSAFMEKFVSQLEGVRDSETFICLRTGKRTGIEYAESL
jgi:DNA-binding Lrp family transcriptional regulator